MMVIVDNEGCTEQVTVPFIQCTDNCKEFFFMHWIVLFCTIELCGLEGDGTCSFPSRAK